VKPTRYRISVRGRLSQRPGSAVEDMSPEAEDGQTALVGDLRDRSHPHGVLDTVRNLGSELVTVEPIASSEDRRTDRRRNTGLRRTETAGWHQNLM
jgi:hypothetical protein